MNSHWIEMEKKGNRKVSVAEVRLLGKAFIVFAFLMGALVARKLFTLGSNMWYSPPWQAYAAVLFLILGILCLFLGLKASPIYLAWANLGDLLAKIVSPIVMGALYYLVVTPFAWMYRLFKRDSLGMGFDPARVTYWQDPGEKKTSRRRLLRQY